MNADIRDVQDKKQEVLSILFILESLFVLPCLEELIS